MSSGTNSSVALECSCGAFGATLGATFTYPMDTVKTRVQAGLFTGFSDCAKATIKKEGVKGFYRGFSTPFASHPLYIGSAFGALELGKLLFDNCLFWGSSSPTDHPVSRLVVSGTVSGLVCATVVTPFERVRVLMQSSTAQTCEGPISVLRTAIREQGTRSVFRGLGATIGREIPGCIILFGAYEATFTNLIARGWDRKSAVTMGGVAAAISFWTMAMPFDRVKTMQQKSRGKLAAADGIVPIARRLYATGGSAAFFVGLNVVLTRGIVIDIIQFSAADQLRLCFTEA
jgi:solute carrier family 25 carnitine/acylcarnitine transporter 20/29